ncbi:hypothetical protein sr13901 [Sporisorium reilianum SRZ2]|uniref:Uncharacterized protein n=1 Tax=Sporisorium reilianum (strain SRZ2) TaxID=999809 RepID=E7A184_SPORE|nr:hypothetical protein sr13901 [Sporisorium reilianum SRZ2]
MKLLMVPLLFATILLHCAPVIKAVKDNEEIVRPDFDHEGVRFSRISFENLRPEPLKAHVKLFYKEVAIPMWNEKETVTGAHWNQYLRNKGVDPTEPEVNLDELAQKIREGASKAHP